MTELDDLRVENQAWRAAYGLLKERVLGIINYSDLDALRRDLVRPIDPVAPHLSLVSTPPESADE